jgi:hypothetical protein
LGFSGIDCFLFMLWISVSHLVFIACIIIMVIAIATDIFIVIASAIISIRNTGTALNWDTVIW